MGFPKCSLCGKGYCSDPGMSKRAARNLQHTRRNEDRIFHSKRCHWQSCPNPSYVVATTGIQNARIRRHKMHERTEQDQLADEIEEVTAQIIADWLEHGTDVEQYRQFLAECYSAQIADKIISDAKGKQE